MIHMGVFFVFFPGDSVDDSVFQSFRLLVHLLDYQLSHSMSQLVLSVPIGRLMFTKGMIVVDECIYFLPTFMKIVDSCAFVAHAGWVDYFSCLRGVYVKLNVLALPFVNVT